MKDTYSDDVLEALKGNPNVKLATKRRIELTLEFRQRMYDSWTANPGRVVIREFFRENGIDPSVFSPETFRHFNCFFKKYGRPEKKNYKTGPKKYSTKSPEQRSDEDQSVEFIIRNQRLPASIQPNDGIYV